MAWIKVIRPHVCNTPDPEAAIKEFAEESVWKCDHCGNLFILCTSIEKDGAYFKVYENYNNNVVE